MRANGSLYDPSVLDALGAVVGEDCGEVREMPLRAVQVGMTFVQDVLTRSGALFIARGHEVTPALAERIRNLSANHVQDPVRVTTKRAGVRP